jgi:nucleoside transporter
MFNRRGLESDLSLRSPPATIARISAMMFLQYWPQGVWSVTVGTYIAANTGSAGAGIFSAGFVGYSTSAGAIGGLLSPVLLGFLSDRYFSAQYLVALMHVGCALAAWGMSQSETQPAFFLWLVVYYQCFSPAASLTNKIGLRHLKNSDVEYPFVRIFSTVGWITAGLFIGFAWPAATGQSIENTRIPLLIGAVGSAAMAAYSLTLPKTPPEEHTGVFFGRIARDCRDLLRNRPLVVFLVVSVLACMPSMAYNNFANPFLNHQSYRNPAALMTLGQLSDVIFLALTPWFIQRFGIRKLFVSGIIAWGIRYALLAAGSFAGAAPLVLAAILIHGACYVFVYVIGVMYVDNLVEGHHRGTAQGVYTLASTGLGHLLGALMVGCAQAIFLTPEGISPAPYNWPLFWIIPAILSAAAAIAFLLTSRRANRGRPRG